MKRGGELSNIREELDFEIVHFGVNCVDELEARKNAETFAAIFGFPIKEGKDSIYASPSIEIMKGSGRGKCGHIAVASNDIHKAQKYLENQGLEFDPTSVKYSNEGNLIVIYLKNEIAGFAIHLLQR